MKRDKRYKQHQKYAEKLMQENAELVAPKQADFLKKFSDFRHFLHAFAHQYFYFTKKSVEIDNFFAVSHSMAYFKELGLDYPQEFFMLFAQLQISRDKQFTDFQTSVQEYAVNNEALNLSMEHYLQSVDEKFGTKYCPTGSLRDPTEDPIRLTVDKLYTANERNSNYQARVCKRLSRMNELYKQLDNDIDL